MNEKTESAGLVFVFPLISGAGGYKIMAGDRFQGLEICGFSEQAEANGVARRINASDEKCIGELRKENAALKERAEKAEQTAMALGMQNEPEYVRSLREENTRLEFALGMVDMKRDEAVRAERERCAKIAESLYGKTYWDDLSSGIAGAIRAGKEKANGD
jgi:hypothetical protein